MTRRQKSNAKFYGMIGALSLSFLSIPIFQSLVFSATVWAIGAGMFMWVAFTEGPKR